MPTGITLAGRGSLRADGKVYNCTKIDPAIGNEKREKVSGLGGVAGDKVTPVAPKCDATIIVRPVTAGPRTPTGRRRRCQRRRGRT